MLPARYMLSAALSKRGDSRGAERMLRVVLDQAPDFAEARYNLGVLLQREARAEEAAEHLRAAVEADPDNARAMVALGTVLAELELAGEATLTLERAVGLAPQSPEARYNLGLALSKAGALAEAAEQFRAALDLRPDYADARRALGVSLQRQEDLAGAARELRATLAAAPRDGDTRNTLGTVLLRIGDLSGAIREFEEAVRIDGSLVKAHRNLAQAYQRAGRPEDARASSQRSVVVADRAAKRRQSILMEQQGRQLLEHGDFAAAVAVLREATEASPDFEDAQLRLGSALRQLGSDREAAIEVLGHCLELNPDRAEAHFEMGLALADAEAWKAALEAFEKATSLAPSMVPAQRALGMLALRHGRAEIAVRALIAVLAWNPDDRQAGAALGEARLALGGRPAGP